MIPIKNTNRIDTQLGIYKDIQVNLLDIIERGLYNEAIPSMIGPLTFQDQNPELISIQQTPAIFAWVEGEDTGTEEAGGGLGRSLSEKNTFYVVVQLVYCGLDEQSGQDDILALASTVRKIITENLNLNDIANGGGKVVEVTLAPSLLRVNDRVRAMRGFKILLEYTQTSRSRRATR